MSSWLGKYGWVVVFGILEAAMLGIAWLARSIEIVGFCVVMAGLLWFGWLTRVDGPPDDPSY